MPSPTRSADPSRLSATCRRTDSTCRCAEGCPIPPARGIWAGLRAAGLAGVRLRALQRLPWCVKRAVSPVVANSPDFSFAPVLTGGFRAGDNEYCKLSDMVDAVKILSRSLALVNESAGKRPQTPAS